MSRTGTDFGLRFGVCGLRITDRVFCPKPKTQNPKPNKAFTLVEVMVTAAVLSVGAVMIYETFFTNLSAFYYCEDYLNIAPWMDEKIWETRDLLRNYGPDAVIATEGNVERGNRVYNWGLSCAAINGTDRLDLYKIRLALYLRRGSGSVKLSRNAYALYEYEDEK